MKSLDVHSATCCGQAGRPAAEGPICHPKWLRFAVTMAVLFCAAVVPPSKSFAQGQFGAIVGTVTDSSGGAIPGASVTAVDIATGTKTVSTSNAAGFFQVMQLRPSIYRLEVTAQGFRTLERPSIRVQVADRITLDAALEIGAVAETVTVTGEPPLLRSQDAQSGEVITNTMVQNLPQLRRDPFSLLLLAGNVQGGGSRAEPGSDTRVNGGRTIGLEYKVDGITSSTGLARRVVDTTPTNETVAEFKVITNGISAEYGRLSGGAVEVVTKSGTNEIHGQLFEYFQNDNLNANPWRQNALGGAKVKFSQNIFGGVVGGPVFLPKFYDGRNKTFFFFNYEGLRRRQAGALQIASVPTELERRGDFSETVYNGIRPQLYDQNGTVIFNDATGEYIRQTLLGNGTQIPTARLHPVSVALLQFTPLPNRAPTPGFSSMGNYTAPRDDRNEQDKWGTRLDHNFNDSQRFFGRFQILNGESGQTRWRGPASTANQNRFSENLSVTANYDWSLSPTLLLNARVGANHFPVSTGNLLEDGFSSAAVPFDSITRGLIGNNNVPLVRITGSPTTIITDIGRGTVRNSTTYDSGLSVAKVFTRHTVKVGFQHTRYYDNIAQDGNGTFSFIASPVHRLAGVDFGFGSDISGAHGMASYMLGVNNQAVVNGGNSRANAFNYYAGFVQDDFRVSNKLTLNLGLRWDMESPITERYDRLYFWDPDAPAPFTVNAGYNFAAEVRAAGIDPSTVPTPSWVANGMPDGALRIANTPEFPSRKASFYNWKQFSPRIGAAYQLDSQTVLRGSFAQIFLPTTGSEVAYSGTGLNLADSANAGWHASNDNLVNMISNWSTPYQEGQFLQYQRTNQQANLDGTGPTSPGGFSRTAKMPYELAYSVGVQRQLPGRLLLETTYNANLGRDLFGVEVIGRFPRELFTGGPTGQNRRTYTTQIVSPTAGQTQNNSVVGLKQNLGVLMMDRPYFGAFSVVGQNVGRSNYHGLNMRLERRFSGGLFFLFNYTLSKSLDDVGGINYGSGIAASSLGSKRFQSTDTMTDNYGLSPLDETHVIRFAFNYELPFGRGKKFMNDPQSFGGKAANFALGGWELAGLGSFRSGRPVYLEPSNVNINNNIRVEQTFGSFTSVGANGSNAAFGGNESVFYSDRDPRPASLERRFSGVTNAEVFTYGTLPAIFPNLRHPSNYNYDMSLMKAFYFSDSAARYLQMRMEATNFLNIRGFGNYNTTINTPFFGLITGAGNQERRIQLSARIVF